MRREIWISLFAAAIAAAAVAAGMVAVADRDHDRSTVVVDDGGAISRTISVAGSGSITVRPDTADVSIGVQVNAATADAALSQANDAAAKLIDAVKGAGVDDADIRTSGLSVYPNYSDSSTIASYTASNSVTVTVHDIDRAGPVIDAAATAAGGAITIGGISFYVDDVEAVLGAAREEAVDNARARAGQYAAAAGVEVGDVLSISETGVSMPPVYAAGDKGESGSPTPVEPGSQELSVSVSVVFALD